MRCFVALTISPNSLLRDVIAGARPLGRVVGGENLHLTLKFLGEIEDVEGIREGLRTIRFHKFSISLRGLGAFPTEQRGRILFVKAEPVDTLMDLAREVHSKTMEIPLDHPFTPHITILRAKDRKDLSSQIGKYGDREFLRQEVDDFSLFQSTLYPAGPVYTEIERFQLM